VLERLHISSSGVVRLKVIDRIVTQNQNGESLKEVRALAVIIFGIWH